MKNIFFYNGTCCNNRLTNNTFEKMTSLIEVDEIDDNNSQS